jgi:formylglycine-generating enzyme required for sulfatase activity
MVAEKAAADRIAAEKAIAEADRIAAEKAILAESPLVNSIGLEFKKLPAGKFAMGENDEVHEVILSQPFYIGIEEVTQEQYQQVMGENPSSFVGKRNPVESVSWDEAAEFCRRLSDLPEEKKAGRVYRLPTEAEWEYACRAGTTTKYSFGNDEPLVDYGCFGSNSDRKTHFVGEKKPNDWGLYDMHGNVWEWCSDWYGEYPKSAVIDPSGPNKGSSRVRRGGGWDDVGTDCRSANRLGNAPVIRTSFLGFRVALSFPEIPK